MADTLRIQDLAVDCRLGVSEEERAAPQTIWIDLALAVDAARAAAGDDVRSTVDYAALVSSVRELAQRKPYRLLETLAEEVASLVLGESETAWVRVEVRKRALPGIGYAAVTVERTAARRRAERRGVRLRPRLAKAR